MVGVDVRPLNRDERLDIAGRGTKPLPKKVRNDLDELGLQPGEPRKLGVAAGVADLDKLLVDQLDATLTGDLKQLDLGLHEEVESHLGHKQAWPGTRRVANCRPDIQCG